MSCLKVLTDRRIDKLQFISKICRAYLTAFALMLISKSFPLTIPNRSSNGGIEKTPQSREVYNYIQFEIRKRLAC